MNLFQISILFLLCSLSLAGGDSNPDANKLIGKWQVDLRPTPDAAAYYQEFVVTGIDSNSFKGTFYGTEIRQAHTNLDWGKVYFAFITGDGSGAYNTSGFLDGDTLRGTTHSIGRQFLSVWTATKTE